MNPRLIPNTCQVPNVILDTVMAKVSHAEFKILMAIVRKTYGWGKDSDRISLSQLIKMTGVSNRKVIDSVRALDWIILTHKLPNGTTEYSINIDSKTGELSSQVESERCEVSSQGSEASSQVACEVSSQGSEASSQVACEVSSHTKPTLKPTSTKPIPPKKVRSPNPQVKQFIQWWSERYKNLLKDDYMVRWELEGSIIKKLLESKSLEEVKKRAERLLTTTDRWLRQHRTIPMLSSKWNELGQQAPFESEQEGPSMRVL